MMNFSVIALFIILLIISNQLLFIKTQQSCSSTIAITSCPWSLIKLNNPLEIPNYKTYLSFTKGDLKHIPKRIFQHLPQITTLQLSGNKIETIEDGAFQDLINLKVLKLNDNHLNNNGIISLNCPNLEQLDLSLNRINTLNENVFEKLLNLVELNLDFNNFNNIPRSAINKLEKLKILRFGYNKIVSINSDTFYGLKNLEELFINDNAINRIEENAFKGLIKLKKIDLKFNFLTDFLSVSEFLKDKPQFTLISLNGNSFNCNKLNKIYDEFKRRNVALVKGVSKNVNNVNGISCTN